MHSGYLNYTGIEEDLFRSRQGSVDKEFVKHLKPETVEHLTKHITIEELLQKHTMYPFYGRFIDGNRRNMAFGALMSMEGDFSKLFCVPQLRKGEKRYMRYCPLCVLSDREKYGETYWHRVHQMRDMKLCPIHGCSLVDSNISFDTKEWSFLVSAEEVIPSKQEELQSRLVVKSCSLEIELSQYMAEVFQEPIDRSNMTSVKDFLHSRMVDTPYISFRGEKCYYHKLLGDMKDFFHAIPQMESITDGQIERLLIGKRVFFSEICMVAMFLRISAKDLAVMKEPAKTPEQQFDEKVMKLMESGIGVTATARELGVSLSIVEMAIRISQKEKSVKRKNVKNNCIKKNWEEIDEQMIPMVKKAISELHGDGAERPHRISICAVSKKLNIPNHWLYNMKQCKKEIEQHIENDEQFWARKAIWAMNVLQREEKPLMCWRICHITKLEKEKLISCLPYLRDMLESETYEQIRAML